MRKTVNVVAVEHPGNTRIQHRNRIQGNCIRSLNEIKFKRCSRCYLIAEILIIRGFKLRTDRRSMRSRGPISGIKLIVTNNREKFEVEGTRLAE